MPWVRFDDQYPIHRKVDGLTDAAFRLHTSAIFWCARNLTDGFVPEEDLDGVTARVRTPSRFAAECVRRGVWHDARHRCPSQKCPGPVDGDGWMIHDYWEYQPSKEQVIREREANARRQKKWRDAHNASSNGVSNGVSNSAPARPYVSTGSSPSYRSARARDPTSDLPASRPVGEAVRLPPGYEPASPETVRAAADQVRQALIRKNPGSNS